MNEHVPPVRSQEELRSRQTAWLGQEDEQGRGIPGFFLGLLFGPIGWIVIIFLRPGHDEAVRREAERQRVVAEAAEWNAREAGQG